ncbi:hypothetical protein ACFVS7_34070 [Streptomyces rubiginosohelvolus]
MPGQSAFVHARSRRQAGSRAALTGRTEPSASVTSTPVAARP